jgi:DNA polymerase III epsilon subunit-like protein
MKLVVDLEANGLDDATVAWCICAKDLETGEMFSYRPTELEQGMRLLNNADELILHNGIDYDIPLLERLYGFTYNGRIIDTLVLSKLLNPDLAGGHSLKSWGKRLGILKGTYAEDEGEDCWDTYSEEMLKYCEQDVEVTYALYIKLMEVWEKYESD